jgi:hypothetical protein
MTTAQLFILVVVFFGGGWLTRGTLPLCVDAGTARNNHMIPQPSPIGSSRNICKHRITEAERLSAGVRLKRFKPQKQDYLECWGDASMRMAPRPIGSNRTPGKSMKAIPRSCYSRTHRGAPQAPKSAISWEVENA